MAGAQELGRGGEPGHARAHDDDALARARHERQALVDDAEVVLVDHDVGIGRCPGRRAGCAAAGAMRRACRTRRSCLPRARRRATRAPSASATFCSTSSTATPSPWMRSIIANIVCTMSGDKPSDGSSSSSSRGCAISARAIATICCCPPDSAPAGRVELLGQRGKQRAYALERRAARRACFRDVAAEHRGSRARSCAVNRRRPSGTMAMPSAQKRCGGKPREVAPVERHRARRRRDAGRRSR